jgi:hypothetical protein
MILVFKGFRKINYGIIEPGNDKKFKTPAKKITLPPDERDFTILHFLFQKHKHQYSGNLYPAIRISDISELPL